MNPSSNTTSSNSIFSSPSGPSSSRDSRNVSLSFNDNDRYQPHSFSSNMINISDASQYPAVFTNNHNSNCAQQEQTPDRRTKKQCIRNSNVRSKREHQKEAEVDATNESEQLVHSLVPVKTEGQTNTVRVKKEEELPEASVAEKLQIAVFGPVLGQFETLAYYIKTGGKEVCQKVLHKKAPYDACFCVGPFFHDDAELQDQAKKLLSGKFNLPCPVYFFDTGTLPKGIGLEVLLSDISAHNYNLSYLKASDGVGDIISLVGNRIRVAFTSPEISSSSSTILEQKCKDPSFQGCDFLFTSEWGKGILKIIENQHEVKELLNDDENRNFLMNLINRESLHVSKVAFMVRPRYHFAPSTSSLGYCYFQTPSFANTNISSLAPSAWYCCKGFYALGCCASRNEKRNQGKLKFFWPVSMIPVNEMSPVDQINESNLPKLKPNPYLHSATKLNSQATMHNDKHPIISTTGSASITQNDMRDPCKDEPVLDSRPDMIYSQSATSTGTRPRQKISRLATENGSAAKLHNDVDNQLENEYVNHGGNERSNERSSSGTSRRCQQQQTILSGGGSASITQNDTRDPCKDEPILDSHPDMINSQCATSTGTRPRQKKSSLTTENGSAARVHNDMDNQLKNEHIYHGGNERSNESSSNGTSRRRRQQQIIPSGSDSASNMQNDMHDPWKDEPILDSHPDMIYSQSATSTGTRPQQKKRSLTAENGSAAKLHNDMDNQLENEYTHHGGNERSNKSSSSGTSRQRRQQQTIPCGSGSASNMQNDMRDPCKDEPVLDSHPEMLYSQSTTSRGTRARQNIWRVTTENGSAARLQNDMDNQLENEFTHHGNGNERSNESSSSRTSRRRQQQRILPIIAEMHYDENLYEEPTLHGLIINGRYEEATNVIIGKVALKKKVKEEENNSNSNGVLQVESFLFGELPIHSLLTTINPKKHYCGEERLKLLQLLLRKLPEGANTRDLYDSNLPLHLACNPCINIEEKDTKGFFPTGMYSLSIDEVDDKMIRLLIEAYPAATKVICEGRRSVLHCLLEHRPSLDLVKYLLHESESVHSKPDQDVICGSLLKHCDGDGQLPLHTAIQYYAPCEVIQYLIQMSSISDLDKKMKDGDTPLHSAAFWGCTKEVMMSLLDRRPEAVVKKNLEGSTPIEEVFSRVEIWNPNFSAPEIVCDDETKKRIISFQPENEMIIPPANLVSPLKFLESMIEAYHKRSPSKAISKIRGILKPKRKKILEEIKNIRDQIESREKKAMLNEAELYIRRILDGE